MLQEEILLALTETERRIVEAYLQRRGRAKDLAKLLGVSERTVYKALYKYRKLARERGIDPSAFYLRGGALHTEIPRESSLSAPHSLEDLKREILAELIPVIENAIKQTLMAALRGTYAVPQCAAPVPRDSILAANDQINKLIISIEKLNENLVKFNRAITSLYSSSSDAAAQRTWHSTASDASLPSFVVDNPWLEVLSRAAR